MFLMCFILIKLAIFPFGIMVKPQRPMGLTDDGLTENVNPE